MLQRAKPHTLIGRDRLESLQFLSQSALTQGIAGDIVECGVYRGGSAMILAHALINGPERTLWLYDNFSGVLPPGPRDPQEGWRYVSSEPGLEISVRSLVSEVLPSERCMVRKGLFAETFRQSLPSHIALLHIDCDWYESVLLCLRTLAPLVSDGGVIILDDYGHFSGCREAFETYCSERGIHPKLHHVGYTQVWWQVERSEKTSTKLSEYIRNIAFCMIQPMTWFPDLWGSPCTRRFQRNVESWNTVLPAGRLKVAQELKQLTAMPKLSTLAIGALLNRAVSLLPGDQFYINVGTWFGFSLFAGMIGNPTKRCIGVDNFSEFGSPRDAFTKEFTKRKSPMHEFFAMNFRDYFQKIHRDPIGVYFYDGPHGYQDHLDGLTLAEPFFAPGCIIIIDDTNWDVPQRVVEAFLKDRPGQYRILFDKRTATKHHPTWWNGIMVLEKN